MLIVTAAEMRALDREVIEKIGVPGLVLMDAAGRGVADVVTSLIPSAAARVVVYAGAGSNGGDGYVAARHLHDRGIAVEVIRCAPAEALRGDALVHAQAAERAGVVVMEGDTPEALQRASGWTQQANVVVDALLGTGLEREVTGHFADCIERMNVHPGIKVAIDLPSGLSADRGVPLGACLRADHTVTFAFLKRGLVLAPGFTWAGDVHVIDIGIPERLAHAHGVRSSVLEPWLLQALARPFDSLAHKGTRGHLLVVAGSFGKSGAALLCGHSALRAGAGLVTVASPEPARAALDGRVPELMTAAYPWPADVEPAWSPIAQALSGKRALAVGPGVPTEPGWHAVFERLVGAAAEAGLALVVDADGLNHLARKPVALGARAVITPHPGEAARLLGSTTADVQNDRASAALALATRYAAVAVLKGARTVIAAPDGALAVCPTGNAGLGTAGTGDVLTGMIGSLLAQGEEPWDAACAAVYWHGAAADAIARERGQRGLVASDLIAALTGVLKEAPGPLREAQGGSRRQSS